MQDEGRTKKIIAEMQDFAESLDIQPTWDIILFGDGSGHSSDGPGGWACFGAERLEDNKVVLCTPIYGSVSQGSINWMETMPYWHFLRQYHERKGRDICETNKRIKVQIVSDSKWACNAMSGNYEISTNRDMLTLYGCYHTLGYDLAWKHARRNSILLMKWADEIAAVSRDYIRAVDMPE